MVKLSFCLFLIALLHFFSLEGQKRPFITHSGKHPLSIVYCANDETTASIAANALANDLKLLTGVRPPVVTNISAVTGNAIIIGTDGKSSFISRLEANKKIDIENIGGQWERFSIQSVRNPLNNLRRAIVIAGSDKRGTAYGVFHLSELLGVSPWHWWADVIPEKVAQVNIPPIQYTSSSPTVKFRGVFLNDECWGLNPWASETFEPGEGNIGPVTYSAIFELLLRLRANMIWPAMHPCTNAFYSNPANPEVAHRYGILVGSSHAEPMLRNNVDEWNESEKGQFNFFTNRDAVIEYWDERVEQSRLFESIYTVGMRGIHDSGMLGAGSMQQQVDGLQEIIAEQRDMIKRHVNTDVASVPQVFTPFKEVLDIYDAGLKLPDDITIVWSNDTYGYMLRYPNSKEQKRAGGNGLYYHFSYWGRPHDYLWLSTTHPLLFWKEMTKANHFGVDKLWVVNVGDIKPHEYHISLFFDMAWDISRFKDAGSVIDHMAGWYGRIFGNAVGHELQQVKSEFYQLNFQRRPEFMGWSQTEPTRKTNRTEFNHFEAGDEAQQRLDRFYDIMDRVVALRQQVPSRLVDAYFQLAEYPVMAAGYFNMKKLYMEKAYLYAEQGRVVANELAIKAREAYDSIVALTFHYNNIMAGGKWKSMMYQSPRNLPVFQMPAIPHWNFENLSPWGLAVEGDEQIRRNPDIKGPLNLPTFNNLTLQKYFIDIFLKDEATVKWEVVPSEDWIEVSSLGGMLEPTRGEQQQRLWVSVDWSKVPPGSRARGNLVFRSGEVQRSIAVSADRNDIITSGYSPVFVEDNGRVSIHATNFSRIINSEDLKWEVISGLGYIGGSVWASPLFDLDNWKGLENNGFSTLEYDFFTRGGGEVTVKIYTLPVHPVNSNFSVRVGVSLNDENPVMLDHRTFGRSEEWKINVLRNNAVVTSKHTLPGGGRHVLRIHAIDPAVVVDRVVIDQGGMPSTYSALPETRAITY